MPSLVKMKKSTLLFLLFLCLCVPLHAQVIDQAWIQEHYTKREEMIPMRDGVMLYTAIYEPKKTDSPSPILMLRTPYRCAPYGNSMNSTLWTQWYLYAQEKYTFVFQDVRGKGNSQGEFVNIRPVTKSRQSVKDVDETTDTYDAVDWLVHHVKNNNGNVGLIGSSYPGFYAILGGLSGHPAIKAVVPEAPVMDWFMGDDLHHNGALMLTDAFRFLTNFDRVTRPGQDALRPYKPYCTSDEYSFFLELGALKHVTRLIQDSVKFWHEVMAHPNYDAWWRERSVSAACYHVKPAVLVVGGLFDAEDCFGAWKLYETIRKQSPETELSLCFGPWWHGAWNKPVVEGFGAYSFGSNTAADYRKRIEFPFVQSHLKPGTEHYNAQVNCFVSGENVWRQYASWPPIEAQATSFYLHPKSQLEAKAPQASQSFSMYLSDPAHPVPYTAHNGRSRQKEYMVENQSFVYLRGDVLCFTSAILDADMTVTGAPQADLYVSSSTTDADFVVKIVDQSSPDQAILVRGDVMRARYRNSFEHPQPLVPNKISRIRFTLPDISHTFKKGHRLQIQIQSSWFPLVDRNPQQFVNIPTCENADFVPATIKIFHQDKAASRIILPVQHEMKSPKIIR